MCLEFVDSFGLCNQFGEFTAMWWNKMTGSGSGQIREPPRFFGLYFSQLCVPDRATTMVPALCGIKFPRRGFIAKKASTICGAHCKISTGSSYERANAGFSAGALEQLNS